MSGGVGRGLTDLSAVLGGLAWLPVAALGTLDTVRTLLALGLLVVVPLVLRVVGPPEGRARPAFTAATVLHPVGAPAALASLHLSAPRAGFLAVPWVVFAAALAASGAIRLFERLRERGAPVPLHETAIDAGFVYALVGAGGLLLSGFGVSLWFAPETVLFAAVHFTFAGLILSALTGIAGRALDGEGRLYRVLAALAVAGPGFIGLGISFSALVEVVSVGFFTLAVGALGVFLAVRVAPGLPRTQGALVALSALVLPLSMAFALAFGLARFGVLSVPLDVSTMVDLHGTLNAVGFALVGAAGWRLDPP